MEVILFVESMVPFLWEMVVGFRKSYSSSFLCCMFKWCLLFFRVSV